ncbi:hypothetical protein NC653_018205 [Populus alba x Populus x berolinensis]|uniref:Uncharacterized protein n=1 Tax=Populus alba x Populus x berolinensis TaxID=444605 RepID=A0AAD6QFW8_9ROSI|nr:hypothetical protein NC653_018205 [Populus alba x Populus x berolinensis]
MVMAKARWLDNNLLFPFSFSFFLIVLCFSVLHVRLLFFLFSQFIIRFPSIGLPLGPSLSLVSLGYALSFAPVFFLVFVAFLPPCFSAQPSPFKKKMMVVKARGVKAAVFFFRVKKMKSVEAKWDATQLDLDRNPASEIAKTIKRTSAMQYQQLFKDEESYFKQKSRVQWLHLGNRNTSFFHKSLLHRQVRNRTHSLQDDKELGRMASSYFENLLCAPHLPVTEELNPIFPNTITEASVVAALLPITDDDIQAALFSIFYTKAPGPDGYNALFFKKSWDVIKYDFIAAIKYFFSNNSLPRCVNATRVALVPKQEHPVCLNDFRPISCCNVLDKCIAKLLVIQLKAALVDVIGPS